MTYGDIVHEECGATSLTCPSSADVGQREGRAEDRGRRPPSAQATPKGHETFISRTAPHQGLAPTSGPPCVQDTHRHPQGRPADAKLLSGVRPVPPTCPQGLEDGALLRGLDYAVPARRCPVHAREKVSDHDRPAWPAPVTNQATTAPGKGSRNQTPSDIDIPVTCGYPTQCDATRRIDSPSHGDGQRTNPGHIRQPQGIEPDNHRPEGDKHLNTPRYCSGQRHVSGAQTAWLVT